MTSPVTLRLAADAAGKRIGAAVSYGAWQNDAAYERTLSQEFNTIVAENIFKPSWVWKGPTSYDFSKTDALMGYGQRHNMTVNGHALVWFYDVPAWLRAGDYSRPQLADMLEGYITALVSRYAGKIARWDVVNEAITDGEETYRTDDFWFARLGADYVNLAFKWARAADKAAQLCYNDYGNDDTGTKSNKVYHLLSDMKSRDVPVDVVGWQCHWKAGQVFGPAQAKNAQRLVELGLEIAITELDAKIPLPSDRLQFVRQAMTFESAVDFYMNTPACQSLTLWGFTDKYSWIPAFSPGHGDALIFDADYSPKPAHDAMIAALATR